MRTLPIFFRLFALALLMTTAALPAFAQSTQVKRDPVERDFGPDHFAAGSTISVDKAVAGDLVVAGGNVDVSADIGGDAVVAGGNIRLGGAIKHGLYGMGGRISITGPVQHNVRVAAGKVEIGPLARIAGNVTIGAGEVLMNGAIDGYLQVGAGSVVIDGPIGGNVEIGSGQIELGPKTRIAGKLRYGSREEIKLDPAAQVQGGIQRLTGRADWPVPSDVQEHAGRGAGWVWSVGLMVIAALLVAAMPGVFAAVGAGLRSNWALSLLIGFVALVCIPVAALILLITIVGVPLALATIALYPPLLLVGYVTTGIALGETTLLRLNKGQEPRTGWRVGAAVLGVLVISALGRIPWIGGVVMFVAVLLGIGALLMPLLPKRPLAG